MVQKSSVNQLRLVVEIPLFTTGFSTIPGGCLGFLPSTVGMTPYIKKVMKVMIFFFSSFILSRCLKTSMGCTVAMGAPIWEMEEQNTRFLKFMKHPENDILGYSIYFR